MSTTHTEIPLHAPAAGRPLPGSWPAAQAAQKHRTRRKMWKLVIITGCSVAVLAAAYAASGMLKTGPAADIQLFTVAPRSFPVILEEKGELQAANSIDIRSELEGRATIIYLMPEGSQAKKGDLLVELASDEIDEKVRDAEIKAATAEAAYEASVKELEILEDENASKMRKAELALTLARLALEKYEEGEAVELRQTANLKLEKAKSVVTRTKEDLKDSTELFSQGFITRIELENDKFEAFEAEIELKQAELALEVLDKYTIPMDLQQKQSDVTEAAKELDREKKAALASESKAKADVAAKKSELDLVQEKLTKYRDQKNKSKIFAPADGLVVYAREGSWYRSESQIQAGTAVHERQSLIELPDTSRMTVVIRVHEAQTEHLKEGLPAVVDIEGFSGRQFTGKISRIAVLADSQNRWLNPNLKEYETEILLDGTFTELKPGVTARAQVQVAQLKDVLAVPVQAVYGKGGSYYVFLQEGGKVRPAEVRVGMSSTEYVEIKSGISPGQKIRMGVTDDLKLLLPDNGTSEGEDEGPASEEKAQPAKPQPEPRQTGESPGPGPSDQGVAAPGTSTQPGQNTAQPRPGQRSGRPDRGDSPRGGRRRS